MNDPIHAFCITKLGSDSSPIYQLGSKDGSYTYTIHTSEKSTPHLTVTKQIQCAPPPYPAPPPAGLGLPNSSTPVYNQTISTANIHGLIAKIDISFEQMGGQNPRARSISMKRPNPLASGRQFQTPLGSLEWKESFLNSSQVLLDENERVLARYEKKRASMLSSTKEEMFVICVPGLEPYLDLIITTGFASIECRRRSDAGWEEMFDFI